MTDRILADWRTVRRPNPKAQPVALAAEAGVCSHGEPVEANEPIVNIGAQTVQEPDGRQHVDLTGAEWHPQQCLNGGAA